MEGLGVKPMCLCGSPILFSFRVSFGGVDGGADALPICHFWLISKFSGNVLRFSRQSDIVLLRPNRTLFDKPIQPRLVFRKLLNL